MSAPSVSLSMSSYPEDPDVVSPRKKKRNRMLSTIKREKRHDSSQHSDSDLFSPRVASTMPSKLNKGESRTELTHSATTHNSQILNQQRRRPPSKSYPELLEPVCTPSQDDIAILARIATAAAINQECEIPPDKLVKRKHIIKEIISSEKSYSNDLAILIRHFVVPMRTRGIVSMLDASLLFSNIELVHEASKDLSKKLEDHELDVGEYAAVGEVVLSQIDYLTPVYINYCSNHQTALGIYNKIKTKKKVAKFLGEVSPSETRSLELDAFIIMPVQRICKYPLFFRELLEATPEDHPDTISLQNALSAVNNLLTLVDANSRESHNMRRMNEISTELTSADYVKLIMPGRRFIHEGMLLKRKNTSSSFSERHYFLFSDMIVWSRIIGKDKYEFRGMIPLTSFRFSDLSNTEEYQNAWEIGRRDRSDAIWIVCCKEPKTKLLWLQMLDSVVEKLHRVSMVFGNVGFKISAEHSALTKNDTNVQVILMDLHSRIAGVKDLVSPTRKFLRDGPAFNKSFEERHIFFFNDRVLVTKRKNTLGVKYSLKQSIVLDKHSVVVSLPDEHPFYNRVSIYHVGKHRKREEVTLMLETPELLLSWVSSFASVIEVGEAATFLKDDQEVPVAILTPLELEAEETYQQLRGSTHIDRETLKQYRAQWDDDSSTSECTHCGSTFTTINRRHHCRNCGHIFCNDCTNKRLHLAQLGYKKRVRVCVRCYRKFKSRDSTM